MGDGQEVGCPTPYCAGASYQRTRLQPRSSPCLAHSGWCRRWRRACILSCNVSPGQSPRPRGHLVAWVAAAASSCKRSALSRNRIAPMSQRPIRRCPS
jgi:hypothetical protein